MGNRYYPINGKELASVTTITGLADKSDALIPWAVGLATKWLKNARDFSEDGILEDEDFDRARIEWREFRDEQGHIGTMVHDALEEYHEGNDFQLIQTLRDEMSSKNPVVKRCAEMAVSLYEAAIDKLRGIGKYTVLGLEVKVVNEDEGYAGRFDLLIAVEVSEGVWETWLIDFKTGASFYPEWGMQLAAYAEAWEREQEAVAPSEIVGAIKFKYVPTIKRIKVLRLDKKTLKAHWKEYGGEKDTLTRDNYMTAFKGLRDAFYILKAKKAVKLAWLGR